jgi:hypothetical protein
VQNDQAGALGERSDDEIRDRQGTMPSTISQQAQHLDGSLLSDGRRILDWHRGGPWSPAFRAAEEHRTALGQTTGLRHVVTESMAQQRHRSSG